jgi:hypothetical protein
MESRRSVDRDVHTVDSAFAHYNALFSAYMHRKPLKLFSGMTDPL